MPLPQPNLDDRRFESLVQDGVRAIPRFSKSWTDHNEHDPGITLIQLFAWLTELQHFFLNRVRDGHRLKFLRLLGIAPRPAIPAHGTVAVTSTASPGTTRRLPRGTRIAIGEVPFETAIGLSVATVALRAIVTSSPEGLIDNSATERPGLSFFAFGGSAEKGSRLYLGFDRPFPRGAGRLELALFEGYRDRRGRPVARGSHGDEPLDVTPSATLDWEYSASGAAAWRPLQVLEDGTGMLDRSGWFVFESPADMASADLPPFAEGLYWLRATVREPGYELPPRLESVRLDTVAVAQQETLSEVRELVAEGSPALDLPDPSALELSGVHLAQALGADGLWRDRSGASVSVGGGAAILELGAAPPPPEPGTRLRLVSCLSGFAARRAVAAGTGLPGQRLELDRASVVPEHLRLQVREDEAEPGGWRDWKRVEDFDASGPADPHFVLDAAAGVVTFGDGLHGAAPPAPGTGGSDNLRILSLRVGGGTRGNLPSGARVVLPAGASEGIGLRLTGDATGGAEAETLEEAERRARRELKQRFRAVTDADFSELALATPGLRLARAQAIPLYRPGLEGYPGSRAEAAVTVVVVPFSEAKAPVPSAGFLATVCRHLDRHRLITTRLHVVGPDYVRVGVDATVTLERGFLEATVLARLDRSLDEFLDPLGGGPHGEGWPFGRPVFLSEIYEAIESVQGVDCVLSLSLRGQGDGAGRDAEGNISLPPAGLACAGEHRLEVSSRRSDCRVKGDSP